MKPKGFLLIWFLATSPELHVSSLAHGQGNDKPNEVVQKVVAAWKAKQSRIKTVHCTAKVDTFYPKGFLDQIVDADTKSKPSSNPPTDTTFRGESCSWIIDYQRTRIAKEARLTKPYASESGEAKFLFDPGLYLFKDGQFRYFRLTERMIRDPGRPDADIYGKVSHSFVFDFDDLPLFWLAGGVNGRYPTPEVLRRVEDPSRLVFRGVAERHGHRCVVLETQEQRSDHLMREFWVGTEDDTYPIYFARARDGDHVPWNLDVEYRKRDDELVPQEWSLTFKTSLSGRFRVESMVLNEATPDSAFERPLEPGAVVRVVETMKTMEVNRDGKLVPFGSVARETKRSKYLIPLVAIGLILTVSVLMRRFFKRSTG